jgi:hypothetical protein
MGNDKYGISEGPICAAPWVCKEKEVGKKQLPNSEPGLSIDFPTTPCKLVDLHVPGAKDDAGKEPIGLVLESFPRALTAIAEVAGNGAKKYTRGGWQTVPSGKERYNDALCRHLLKVHTEGDFDKESGSLHLAHAAWNALAVLELTLRE